MGNWLGTNKRVRDIHVEVIERPRKRTRSSKERCVDSIKESFRGVDTDGYHRDHISIVVCVGMQSSGCSDIDSDLPEFDPRPVGAGEPELGDACPGEERGNEDSADVNPDRDQCRDEDCGTQLPLCETTRGPN